MATFYRGAVTREGNMVVRVVNGVPRPLAQFQHEQTRLPLPWEWRDGFYGRWVVSYALLLSATGGMPELAAVLAQRFANELMANQRPERWEFSEDDIRAWVVTCCGKSPFADGK